jgi:DNA-binding response OmpR family regulator
LHVLVIEDDELVAHGIKTGLELHGITVDRVFTVAQADAALSTSSFDICILDLGLPDGDGQALLNGWRLRGIGMPVLILSARDAVVHRVAGLEAGADDYLVKPIDLSELVARLHAIVRRGQGRTHNIIRHGRLRCDPSASKVWVDDQEVDLSRRELALLLALLRNPEHIFTSEQLHSSLYGFADPVGSNALNVHIHHLRRKLGSQSIQTIRGLGYRIGDIE